MNIGIDASRAFTDKKTGTENYSYQLISHLSKVDHTNNYYIYVRPGINLLDKKNSDIFHSNFHPITIPYPRLWTQVGLALQTFKDPLDVLFIPSHTLPLIQKPGLKTVMTVHDLGAEYLPYTHQLKQRLYLDLMTHHELKSASQLIAVSENTKKDLLKLVGVPEEKITVVYEGYNERLYLPVKTDVLVDTLKEFDLIPGQYFLFVGTIQPRKNLERLIKAYAGFFKKGVVEREERSMGKTMSSSHTLPKLILVGSKGWLSDEIFELPKKIGLDQNITFLGYVSDNKMPALYSGAIAFLFPSLFEGFGLPILEAMACGCPVLTSKSSSLPEVAGRAAILVDPYSVGSIAEGIKRIMNQELRIKLIKIGSEQVKKFSWEKAAKETLKVLQEVCQKNPS